ncbi:hypothetical protein GGR50DRAFT_684358 [Xylaria sp. CBS 124048]|nr:hypothetical protein GGR50DRAFT_684358 [Xylaria sp. CBS 124048]
MPTRMLPFSPRLQVHVHACCAGISSSDPPGMYSAFIPFYHSKCSHPWVWLREGITSTVDHIAQLLVRLLLCAAAVPGCLWRQYGPTRCRVASQHFHISDVVMSITVPHSSSTPWRGHVNHSQSLYQSIFIVSFDLSFKISPVALASKEANLVFGFWPSL